MRSSEPVEIEKNQSDPKINGAAEDKEEEVIDEIEMILPLNWDGYDAACLMILILIGIFSRFWIIQYPRHYVRGEDKTIGYINSYINGSFFVDGQPPLATIILSWISYMEDYHVSYHPPSNESNFTFPTMEYVGLRSPSAFFSTVLIPLSFFIVRVFNGGRFGALAAAIFTLLDFSLIANARHVSTDGFIQMFVGFSVLFTALLSHFKEKSFSWWVIAFLQSLFVGFSVSSTYYAIPLLIFVSFYNFISFKNFDALSLNLIVSIFIFLMSFTLHVILLPYHSIYDSVLSNKYQDLLLNPSFAFSTDYLSLPWRVAEVISLSIRSYSHISNDKWYNWPLMTQKWNILWSQQGRYIACFGNLPVWWCICFWVVFEFIKFVFSKKITQPTTFMLIGYSMSISVFFFAKSERGLCDYQIPLLFGIWGMSMSINQELPPTAAGFVYSALILSCIFIFLLWSPLVYGYENFDMRFLPYFAVLP